MQIATKSDVTIRALARHDLDQVVAIDTATSGRSRRAYFERRLAVALKQPELHVQLAAVDGNETIGCILARRTLGEFGRTQPGLRVEVIGVRSDRKGEGIGARLFDALQRYAARHGITELRTAARWDDHRMLGWLADRGFTLAPDLVVECGVGEGYQSERSDGLDLPLPLTPGHETNYGTPEGNDYERVQGTRCDVRPMNADDLPQILRIDRGITGRDRSAYIAGKLGEAMDDSAIRVSLTARLDGAIVGFLMARADLGDFGRVDPAAVLDTVGVDPAYARRGIGHALVSTLFANLGALQIDRVETAVLTTEKLGLLGFLHDVGFHHSQRLSFVRPV
jgi:ribosomal protein S18 acetylase RimI-like enzyme